MNDEITLRDFLAASCRQDEDVHFAALFSIKWAAELCYDRADAMIKFRIKSTTKG